MKEIALSQLLEQLPLLQGKKVLIIGDIVLDHYVTGTVDRISPEAPVPVIAVQQERYLLGGAGNVARNITALGGQAVLAGVCGQDTQGQTIQDLLEQARIHSYIFSDPDRPTTRKTRIIANNQQVARIDKENTCAVSETLQNSLLSAIEQKLSQYQVIIISDYGKGLITETLISKLHALLKKQARQPGMSGMPDVPEVFVDPKTKNFHLYTGMHLLTPNTKEASEGAGIPVHDISDVSRVASTIFETLQCSNLLITLGAEGMALFTGNGHAPGEGWHIPTAAQTVFDVTGAGDTVIATLALARAAGLDLLSACVLANGAAGIVVGEVGAATVTSVQLEKFLKKQQTVQLRSLL